MKNQISNRLVAGLLILTLIGCAGRNARPIQVSRSGDEALACNALEAEKMRNENQLQAMQAELTEIRGYNIAISIVSVIIAGIPLFLIDNKTSGAINTETIAITQRNSNLNRLLDIKDCAL